MHPFLASKFKADWATGLQQHRRILARTNAVADAAVRNGNPNMPTAQASTEDDSVYVDSPTTHNHYHDKPGLNAWWVVSLIAVLAALYAFATKQQPAPATPTPAAPATPAPAPTPASGEYIEFY